MQGQTFGRNWVEGWGGGRWLCLGDSSPDPPTARDLGSVPARIHGAKTWIRGGFYPANERWQTPIRGTMFISGFTATNKYTKQNKCDCKRSKPHNAPELFLRKAFCVSLLGVFVLF